MLFHNKPKNVLYILFTERSIGEGLLKHRGKEERREGETEERKKKREGKRKEKFVPTYLKISMETKYFAY